MLRFLLRFLGGLALAGAFAQTIVDGARWIAGGRLVLMPLLDLVAVAAPGRFEALATNLGAAPWALASLKMVLAVPAFAALSAIAAFLLFLARPPADPTAGLRIRDWA